MLKVLSAQKGEEFIEVEISSGKSTKVIGSYNIEGDLFDQLMSLLQTQNLSLAEALLENKDFKVWINEYNTENIVVSNDDNMWDWKSLMTDSGEAVLTCFQVLYAGFVTPSFADFSYNVTIRKLISGVWYKNGPIMEVKENLSSIEEAKKWCEERILWYIDN